MYNHAMDGFEKVPERMRHRLERLRLSPQEYDRLREKVRERGPEFMEKELQHMEKMAELKFALETEPGVREAVRSKIQEDIKEKGVEEVLEVGNLPLKLTDALEKGRFDISIEPHPETKQDQLMVVPEGNVSEKIPVKGAMSEQYVGQVVKGK